MWDWISALERVRAQGQRAALLTVTSVSGSTPREVGAKLLLHAKGSFEGTIGGGHLEMLALEDARVCLREGRSQSFNYPLGAKTGQCCGGSVDIFVEVIGAGPRLYVFGAGHVGQAIARVFLGTPFQVHLVDERKEWLERSPAEAIRHEDWESLLDDVSWDERCYAVVMTHRHDLDQEILEKILRKPLKYLGLIGSDSKWQRFQQRFEQRGMDSALWRHVQCPIGVDTGGKAPQEVAISLAAELLGIHYGRRS